MFSVSLASCYFHFPNPCESIWYDIKEVRNPFDILSDSEFEQFLRDLLIPVLVEYDMPIAADVTEPMRVESVIPVIQQESNETAIFIDPEPVPLIVPETLVISPVSESVSSRVHAGSRKRKTTIPGIHTTISESTISSSVSSDVPLGSPQNVLIDSDEAYTPFDSTIIKKPRVNRRSPFYFKMACGCSNRYFRYVGAGIKHALKVHKFEGNNFNDFITLVDDFGMMERYQFKCEHCPFISDYMSYMDLHKLNVHGQKN